MLPEWLIGKPVPALMPALYPRRRWWQFWKWRPALRRSAEHGQ